MSIPNHRRQEPPRRSAHPRPTDHPRIKSEDRGSRAEEGPRTKDDPAAPKPGKGRTPSASAAASTTLETED